MELKVLTPERIRLVAPAATIDFRRVEGEAGVSLVVRVDPVAGRSTSVSLLLDAKDVATIALFLANVADKGGG